MKHIAFAVTVAFLISGCNPAFKKPTSESSAQLRFSALQHKGLGSTVSLYAHDGDQCMGAQKVIQLGGVIKLGGLSIDDSDQKMIKDPSASYVLGQYFETNIESNEKFYFTVAAGESGAVCYVTSSFLPEKNGQYEISYLANSNKCYIKIDRIDDISGKFNRRTEPTAKKRETACTFFWN